MKKDDLNYLLAILRELEGGGKYPRELGPKINLPYHNGLYEIIRALRLCGFLESVKSSKQCPTCGQIQKGRMYVITESGREFLASKVFPQTKPKNRTPEQERIIRAAESESSNTQWEEQ